MMATRIRRAIARGELELHCQPHVDCQTGELRGAEALIRWAHPTRGLLLPGEWLPLVEAGRERRRLNLHVIELSVAHRERWLERGLDLPLAINVTPACLADEKFITGVERLFAGRSPQGSVSLEITEQATVFDGLAIDESIDRLRRQGFEFMLDDFGAEYSSLSRLANLPFSTLKIDGGLVREMAKSRSHRSIVHASIQLAHTLGLKAVAEQVEDRGTWALLQAFGCDQIQGYYVSRPLLADSLPAFAAAYVPTPPQSGREPRGRRVVQRRTNAEAWLAESERRDGADRRTGSDRRSTLQG